ncbi:MAG: mannosyltransferase family protein, partial [Vulcanimicrobiaceae bacterium]
VTLAACGPLPFALVGLGGLGLGSLLWYVAIEHSATLRGLGDPVLGAALVLGVALGFAGWIAYGTYVARRGGIPPVTSLRADAWSWAALVLVALGMWGPSPALGPARAAFLAFAVWALVKLGVAARHVLTVRAVLTTFVVTRIPIIVIAELASIVVAPRPGVHAAISQYPLLAVWGRWDAVHFLDIAQHGYYGTEMAFFPLYPLAIRTLGALLGNDLLAGLLISNVAFFFGLLFFYKLVEHQFDRTVARRATFYVSIFPTAVFFSAVYSESLFFALTVASFYYISEHRWLRAGVLGALASATRPEGVLLVVPLLIEAAATAGGWRALVASPRRATRQLMGTALVPLGLLLYMAWLWVLRGDPLYFSHVQVHWGRHFAPPWVSLIDAVGKIAHGPPVGIANEGIQLAFTLLMVALLIGSFGRLRPSLVAYMLLSILVPLSTSSLMSMPRFALVLFPMFMVLALWGKRPSFNNAIVAFSLPLLGLFTVLFANWYWVA